jgi:YesN/AraC family two-component response regulator
MKRILFVDDESRVLDGLRRMLYAQRQRWEMEFALGGEAALEACEKGAFDVVVSDMRMPGMDGATLLGHIRDRYPSSARVILSGFSEAAQDCRNDRTVALALDYLHNAYAGSERPGRIRG